MASGRWWVVRCSLWRVYGGNEGLSVELLPIVRVNDDGLKLLVS